MKTLPTALATHIALGATTLAHALKIVRTDGAVFAWTNASDSVTLGGVLHIATPGLDVSSVETTAGLAVDNLELSTLDDGEIFTRVDVFGGLWRNAAFTISRFNWASPADGAEVLLAGVVGEVEIRQTTIVAELRGLQQYLQQTLGSVSSKTCRARLGDSLCTVNLAPLTYTGSITSVASRQVFTDSARLEAAGWFDEGEFVFLTGAAAGIKQRIKQFAAGQFTLALPLLQAIAPGDTYSVVTGCRKRASEDCAAKFNNILNFQGEPHLPGIDALTSPVI